MNHKESFFIGLLELKSNKLKTALTMLGIVFGVASVIAMLSIGEGARQESLEQIELLGTNNIIIKSNQNKSAQSGAPSFSTGLTLDDAKSIRKINPYVDDITPQKEGFFNVTYKAKVKKLKIVGTTSNYTSTFNTKIKEGKFFKEHHLKSFSNVCVIGPDIKREFFKFESALNKQIKIGDFWFRIIGVTESKNSAANIKQLGAQNFNSEIYIPLSVINNKIEITENNQNSGGFFFFRDEKSANIIDRRNINKLTVKIKDDKYIVESAALIKRILNRKHFNTPDFDVIVPEEIIAQKQKTQRIFNIVMGAIAGISLLVGGIGIMNIMLATILERTREIGIRRAVGATKKDILAQFLYEALIISILGGVIGLIIGFILTSVITTYAEWRTIITPYSVILAFIVAVGTGVGFGSYPAKKAAEKDPIESLRYE
ncbi:MAG: ABC transporter permease [Rhodothermaceae bacterium]